MYKEKEIIRYREPLDADYTYAEITELKKGRAEVKIVGLYHTGLIVEIPYRYIEHIQKRR